jgi:hypothetical protein
VAIAPALSATHDTSTPEPPSCGTAAITAKPGSQRARLSRATRRRRGPQRWLLGDVLDADPLRRGEPTVALCPWCSRCPAQHRLPAAHRRWDLPGAAGDVTKYRNQVGLPVELVHNCGRTIARSPAAMRGTRSDRWRRAFHGGAAVLVKASVLVSLSAHMSNCPEAGIHCRDPLVTSAQVADSRSKMLPAPVEASSQLVRQTASHPPGPPRGLFPCRASAGRAAGRRAVLA